MPAGVGERAAALTEVVMHSRFSERGRWIPRRRWVGRCARIGGSGYRPLTLRYVRCRPVQGIVEGSKSRPPRVRRGSALQAAKCFRQVCRPDAFIIQGIRRPPVSPGEMLFFRTLAIKSLLSTHVYMVMCIYFVCQVSFVSLKKWEAWYFTDSRGSC